MPAHTGRAPQGTRMIVPEYWAEARLQTRQGRKQVTVRRFGWSDTDIAAAQRHAEERAQAAMDRILAGEPLRRREPKVPYNGAEGVPIREEIVARHGDAVVTRNAYGALCLNAPDALFVDIDFDPPQVRIGRGGWALLLLTVATVAVAVGVRSWPIGIVGVLVALLAAWRLARINGRGDGDVAETEESRAYARIDAFVQAHPDWGFRRYRTPAGLRLLATHRVFSPHDPDVALCFEALRADPLYARMCERQHCFRARVSPKPWRMGMAGHIRPRPGTWPVNEARMPERRAWIAQYEDQARGYAACRFVDAVGNAAFDGGVDAVRRLHDDLCRAESALPLA